MICSRCNYAGPFRVCGDGKTEGLLYGCLPDGSIICAPCCGEVDRLAMIETGRAVLYLNSIPTSDCMAGQPWNTRRGALSNWPGTLEFKTTAFKVGRHNMARRRYDVWFIGPDGKEWHGVQYGDNTQLCHCRRLKG